MYDEYTDWSDSFDDMDNQDWGDHLGGPDDYYFEQLERDQYSYSED